MPEILIEFVADYSQLDKAIDTLEQLGQVDAKSAEAFRKTNAAMKDRAAAMKGVQDATSKELNSLTQLDAKTRKFVESFVEGFSEGIITELQDAQSEIDKLKAKLSDKKPKDAIMSLKTELKGLTAQIASAKASGGPIDPAWIKRAGELKDAMNDANAAIKEAGSDTRGIDNLLGTATALAGAFSLVQGTVALFGDENKELEKTLLKVNASMAALQGLQAVVNSLQAEGAVTLALLQVQEKLHNAEIALTGALESKNIIVRYAAAAAQKVLNAVMAANPYALVATALISVITAMALYTKGARSAAEQAERLNNAIDPGRFNAEVEALQRNARLREAQMKANGDKESAILTEQLANERRIQNARIREVEALNDAINKATDKGTDEYKAALDRRAQLLKEIDEANTDGQIKNIDLLGKKRAEALENERKAAEAAAKAKQDAEDKLKASTLDSIYRLKKEQLAVKDTTETYGRLQAGIINLQAQYDAIGKSAAEAAYIQAKALVDINAEMDRVAPKGREVKNVIVDLNKTISIDTTKALAAVSGMATNIVNKVNTTTTDAGNKIIDFLEKNRQAIQNFVAATSAVSSGLQNLANEQAAASRTLTDNKKRETEELLKAGAITEKEAAARNKRIEAAERRAQLKAAQQQKQAAIFSAIISGAQAVVNALATPPAPFGIALAAIVGGLALAQVRAISRRPLPKFAVGKKGSWSGVGVMGEAGTEMKVSKDGQLQVADKPTVTYVGPTDKIYTAGETKKIMQNMNYHITKPGRVEKQSMMQIDYDRLAHAVNKGRPVAGGTTINIDKDFVAESVAGSLSRMMYMQRRYMLKK